MALAMLMVWVYNKSHGSILIMMLMHAASNVGITVLPVLPSMAGTWNVAYIYMGIVLLVTLAVIVLDRSGFRAEIPLKTVKGEAA